MQLFEPKEWVKPQPLWRQRPREDSSFTCFGVDGDTFEVFIHAQVLVKVWKYMWQAAPNECMGIVAGRCCTDQAGPYTVITEAEVGTADEADASPGFVKLSQEVHAQVRRRLEKANPVLESVGWFHSHPTFKAQFSGEDFQEQKTWTDDRHIGLLVSGTEQQEPFAVYRGPEGQKLTRRTPWSTSFSPHQPKPRQPRPIALQIPEHVHTLVVHHVWHEHPKHSRARKVRRFNQWWKFLATSAMSLVPVLLLSIILMLVM